MSFRPMFRSRAHAILPLVGILAVSPFGFGAASAASDRGPVNGVRNDSLHATRVAINPADSLVSRLLAALGAREVWSNAAVDHISAVVEPPGGEPFMIELYTRWDWPGTISWVRMRSREQLRVWDGERGWTATRVRGQDAVVTEWSAARLAAERAAYRTQGERAFHRISRRDPSLSFAIGTGEHAGWLDVRDAEGTMVLLELRPDGSPARLQRGDEKTPIHFGTLVSFGDHKQPGSGATGPGEKFTTYVAELLPSAAGIHWGPPRGPRELNPAR
jgi:hypothetical protein